MNKIFIYGIIFLVLLTGVNALCNVNVTVNDSVNKYSLIQCEETGGTAYHLEQNKPDLLLGVIILLPLILGFLLMYWATNLGEDHNVLKILVYLSPIPLFYISARYAFIVLDKFYVFDDLIGAMSDDIYIFGLMFILIVIYFLLYIIIRAIKIAANEKTERLNY